MDDTLNRFAMLTPGAVFHDRYEIRRCLRAGGMGTVCEVIDRHTSRRRALKTILPEYVTDPGLRERFKHEATITAEVDSEHLVEVFDAGIDEATGIPFIVMELLKGQDLGELLARRKRLPPEEVVVLLHQASQALDRTHALNIVHRDLKPENLYLTRRDDDSPRLRILDFGIAKLLTDSTRCKTTGIMGSPMYMAPEQAVGQAGIGPAADIYALGHVAFTLLVGEAFWEETARQVGSPVVLLVQVTQGSKETATLRAAALGMSLPSSFDGWFAKATAHAPRERFETASELVEALAEVLAVPLPTGAARELPPADGAKAARARSAPADHGHGSCAAVSNDPRLATRKRRAVPTVVALVSLAAFAVVALLVGARLLAQAPTASSADTSVAPSSAPSVESNPLPGVSVEQWPVVVPEVDSAEPAPSAARPSRTAPSPSEPRRIADTPTASVPPARSVELPDAAAGKAPEPPASTPRVQDPSDLY